jgi:hypothetical protein
MRARHPAAPAIMARTARAARYPAPSARRARPTNTRAARLLPHACLAKWANTMMHPGNHTALAARRCVCVPPARRHPFASLAGAYPAPLTNPYHSSPTPPAQCRASTTQA